MERTQRPIALITGASSGIGAALTAQYAANGYDLVLVARRRELLDKLATEMTAAHGVRAAVLPFDLAKPGAVDALATELARTERVPYALVNNAGIGQNGLFVATDAQREDEMIELNVAVLTRLTKRLLPAMVARGSGHVLNVASTAAFQPGPYMAVYCATKAYVLSFSEALSEELRGTGVTVTALCPGSTSTEFASTASTESSLLFREKVVMRAEDVARKGYASAVRAKAISIPGVRNALLAFCVRFFPRSLVVRITRALLAPRNTTPGLPNAIRL